jgi:hypothetical protein
VKPFRFQLLPARAWFEEGREVLSWRWYQAKERVREVFKGPRPPPKPLAPDDPLHGLLRALEAGEYETSPSSLVRGSALVVEDLAPVMACVTYIGPRGRRYFGETTASWAAHNDHWRIRWTADEPRPKGGEPRPEFHWWVPALLRRRAEADWLRRLRALTAKR